MFLPTDSSYQDVQLKPRLLTLAYAQALQYWAKEANPLASGKPHPLVMSVREVRWCIRRYTTFSESDIFEGLGNAAHEATYGDTGTPPVDSTTSSVMPDMEDTQHWQLNPMLRPKRICQPPGVLPLQNWKLQLLPLWYWWIIGWLSHSG